MKENPHAEHRQRLRKRFLQEGLEHFEDHNVLELLLFYAIPRIDTNELAHRLLDTFGSISGVFEASYESLVQVKGISTQSATFLKLIPAVTKTYLSDRYSAGIRPKSFSECGSYMQPKFIGETTEVTYLLCMDNKRKILGCPFICRGGVNSVEFSSRKVVEAALRLSATAVILGHNHPRGLALPSEDDITATRMIYSVLRQVDILLVDHIIFADEDFVSLSDSGLFSQLARGGPIR